MLSFRHRYLTFAVLFLIGFVVVCFSINFSRFFERQHYPEIIDVKILSDQIVWEAKWSPDGTKIAMKTQKRRDVTAPIVIQILDLEKQEIEQIPITGAKLSPSNTFVLVNIDWSPDGEILTISGGPADKPELHGIWFLRLENYEMKLFTKGEYFAWSPTGDRMAVMDDRTRTVRILYLKDNQESIIQSLQPADTLGISIDWSPQGDHLVVGIPEMNDRGYRVDRLYLLDIEGKDFQPFLGNSSWSLRRPIWLPDGKWLSFIADTTEGRVIAVAPTTGQCILTWLPEFTNIGRIDITRDGKKLLVVTFFESYLKIVDIEAAGQHLLPENLSCP